MITGRVTAKSQTTIPRAVRLALDIKPGDEIEYLIEGDEVILRRADHQFSKDPFVNPFATFWEWSTEADSAYDVL